MKRLTALVVMSLCFACGAMAEEPKPLRIAVVTYLSGPGASHMGIPGRNAAELTIEALNAGSVPTPYQTRGFGGRALEMVLLDEAGSTSNVVTQYRNLIQQRGADLVVGYISSGNCLAVAPVAEELQTVTVFFNCGSPRLFEEGTYRYVFRTASHATMDSVGAARYVHDHYPKVRRIAGINQNYAWGLDSWREFESSMQALVPGVQSVTSQMPKLFAGQYGSEISALVSASPEIIHSSFWGGDLEAFMLQAGPRNLFEGHPMLLTTGETQVHNAKNPLPDGTIIGARGPHGVFAPQNALNRWFAAAYQTRYGMAPTFTAYHMVQAIFGAKAAWERARTAAGGRDPSPDQVAAAFEGATFETPSGSTKMALGKGHQGIQGIAYGTTRTIAGKTTIDNVSFYTAEEVNPPAGVKSEDWIKAGLTR